MHTKRCCSAKLTSTEAVDFCVAVHKWPCKEPFCYFGLQDRRRQQLGLGRLEDGLGRAFCGQIAVWRWTVNLFVCTKLDANIQLIKCTQTNSRHFIVLLRSHIKFYTASLHIDLQKLCSVEKENRFKIWGYVIIWYILCLTIYTHIHKLCVCIYFLLY